MPTWFQTITRLTPRFGRQTDLPVGGVAPVVSLFEASGDPAAPSASEPPDASDPNALPLLVEGPDEVAGVHAITRKTDYWFEREAHVIERQASQLAAEWAQRGLPRHDVPRTEPLEPEQVLAARCGQLFRDWPLRVRTKMQDAIAQGATVFGEHVITFGDRIGRLEAIAADLADREQRIERIKRESERDNRPARYERFVSAWLFWPVAVLLMAVEFAANFPVFRLLLPLEASLAKLSGTVADNIDDSSWLAGVELFFRNLAMSVEAFVVALVAVITLVLLGKQFGASLRPQLALDAADQPLAARTILSHQRQHRAVTILCGLGLSCVLAFLLLARGSIAATADARVVLDSVSLVAARAELAKAQVENDRGKITTGAGVVLMREESLLRHRDDASYARTVAANNWAIFLLNLGLIMTAVMLGFGYARADLGDRRGEHPDVVKLRDRCLELRQEQLEVLQQARAAAALADVAESRVLHLLRAHPLRNWESKARRLDGVIPHFRGENARLRGLDPANIKAFDEPPALQLPAIEAQPGFPEPEEFPRYRAERDELRMKLNAYVHRPSPFRFSTQVAAD
jgi:hypothetical protein